MEEEPRKPRRLQITIADILLGMAVAGAFAAYVAEGEPQFIFIALSALILFLAHRPIALRFWIVGMVMLGTIMFVAGMKGQYLDSMSPGWLAAWGAGMVVEAV